MSSLDSSCRQSHSSKMLRSFLKSPLLWFRRSCDLPLWMSGWLVSMHITEWSLFPRRPSSRTSFNIPISAKTRSNLFPFRWVEKSTCCVQNLSRDMSISCCDSAHPVSASQFAAGKLKSQTTMAGFFTVWRSDIINWLLSIVEFSNCKYFQGQSGRKIGLETEEVKNWNPLY